MKTRLLILLVVILLSALLVMGYYRYGEQLLPPLPTPAPTATPVPTPAPVLVMTGFREGTLTDKVRDAAEGAGLDPVSSAQDALSELSFDGVAAMLVYADADTDWAAVAQLYARGVPVLVVSDTEAASDAYPNLTYDGASGTALALETALSYPPHDKPVRLIGLFSDAEGAAYALWQQGRADGSILSRAELVADAETNMAEWMDGTLKKWWVAGTVDAIFCETTALAMDAANALAVANRTDMEVFCAETDEELAALMETYPDLLVAAVGMDNDALADACVRGLQTLLSGGSVADQAFLPTVLWSATAVH